MQIAYQNFGAQGVASEPSFGFSGRPQAVKNKQAPFRLRVLNVPQYLQLEEFRTQFLKVEGCVDAGLESGSFSAYYIDFVSQELADKCAATFANWKGWGPKGLAFQRMGFVVSDYKRPADGDAYQPAKHPRMAAPDDPLPLKQDGLNTLVQLAAGAQQHQVAGQMARGQEGNSVNMNSMYQRAPGSIVGGGQQMGGPQPMLTSQPVQLQPPGQPSMQMGMQPAQLQLTQQGPNQQLQPAGQQLQQHGVQEMPPQVPQQGGHQRPVQLQPPSQTGLPAPGSLAAPVQPQHMGAPASMPVAVQPAPSNAASGATAPVQYVQLQDGTVRAMMPVPGDMAMGGVADPAPAQAQNASNLPAGTVMYASNAGMTPGGVPAVPSNVPGAEQVPDMAQMATPPDVMNTESQPPVGSAMSREEVLPSNDPLQQDGAGALPPGATETLYVEDVPTDMSKRELSHIFRPFGGFKEVRIVNKTKENKSYCFAFAQFETAECAAAALACLHGYQFDPSHPDLGAMQLRYARHERNKPGNQTGQQGAPTGGSGGGGARVFNAGHQRGPGGRHGASHGGRAHGSGPPQLQRGHGHRAAQPSPQRGRQRQFHSTKYM